MIHKPTMAEQLIHVLRHAGVERIYGVVGDSLNPLVDAVRRTEGIEWILVRNEEAGAFAATAEAQLTGRLAVCAGSMMLAPSRRAIEVRLPEVHTPALVVMGSKDRDFKDPAAEAQLVANQLGADVELVDGAGHYPHGEFPQRTAPVVLAFARRVVRQNSLAASVKSH
jgi:pimeloyl-ACP methyl ester carboxylesterase